MVDGRALFDTNILIDQTKSIAAAGAEMSRYRVRAISVVTWMEVLAGVPLDKQVIIREFLSEFLILPITMSIAEEAVRLRRERRLKLPDALILATAVVEDLLLVTRNTRDFEAGRHIRIPYSL